MRLRVHYIYSPVMSSFNIITLVYLYFVHCTVPHLSSKTQSFTSKYCTNISILEHDHGT